jgi:hypothetical protein
VRELHRFSLALQTLHDQLNALRREADQLERDLATKYAATGLSLKVVPKLGPVVHVMSKSNGKIDHDSKAVLVTKTGSTRSYVVPVS